MSTVTITIQGDFSDLAYGDTVELLCVIGGSGKPIRGRIVNRPAEGRQTLDFAIVQVGDSVGLVTNRAALIKSDNDAKKVMR